MGDVPEELKYTEEHEWVRVEGDEVSIGITDFAQNALTEVANECKPENTFGSADMCP